MRRLNRALDVAASGFELPAPLSVGPPRNLRQHGPRLVRFAVTIIVLAMIVLFARRIDWAETWRAIKLTSVPLLVGAALVNVGSSVVKAVRWWIFLRPAGARSLGLALRASLAGQGLNNVLVANGGDAARVIFVARAAHVPSAAVLATLALERLFDLVGYVVLLCLSAVLLNLPPALARTRPFAFASLGAIALLLVYLVRRPHVTAEVAAELATPPPTGFLHRARDYGSRFLRTLRGVSTGPRFAAALALSIVSWVLQVGTYHLTAQAARFPISLVGTISTLLAVNVGFALRATPGNVGLFQFMYAATATAFGLDAERAVAVALLIQTQQILPITALGIALAPQFIFRRRVGRRATDPVDDIPFESRGEAAPPR